MSKTPVQVTHETGSPAAAATPPAAVWPGFGNLRDEMERLFDAFEPRRWFGLGPAAAPDTFAAAGAPPHLCPVMDLSEREDAFVLSTELPGLDPDEIEVKLADGSLTIRGEKSEAEEKTDETWHLRERRWGSFHRAIRLPDSIDRDKVSAEFAKGILTVTLPKTAAAKASERRVAVKAA